MFLGKASALLALRASAGAKAETFDGGRQLQAPVTQSPTPAPWDINYVDVAANFTNDSTNELVIIYTISKGRNYSYPLYAGDCTDATDVTNGVMDGSAELSGYDDSFDKLTIIYDVNSNAIASSNIWNSNDAQIELCQKVRLVIDPPSDELGEMVIVEDQREIKILFDMSVDFNFTNVLGATTIEADTANTTFDGFVDAYKCNGSNFTRDNDDLVPNEELFVCIESTSTQVEIDNLEDMTIQQGAASLPVIADDAVTIPSITSRVYVGTNKVYVGTRVPTSTFNYEVDATIIISGVVNLKLPGGRRLQASIINNPAAEEPSAYEVVVRLQEEVALEEDFIVSSACAFKNSGAFIIGMAITIACATMVMW